jgi:predicted nucleic acid-binding protein
MLILLDSGPLGLLANPSGSAQPARAREWAQNVIRSGGRFAVPEISDYEVRRELLRADKPDGLRRLDVLGRGLGYEPLTTATMRVAAELWAEARRRGLPTAIDAALDGDVILAAQARQLSPFHDRVVVATTNAKHLSRFVDAEVWDQIDAG